jgi:hypothetical protein
LCLCAELSRYAMHKGQYEGLSGQSILLCMGGEEVKVITQNSTYDIKVGKQGLMGQVGIVSNNPKYCPTRTKCLLAQKPEVGKSLVFAPCEGEKYGRLVITSKIKEIKK